MRATIWGAPIPFPIAARANPTLLEFIPATTRRILDLGTGDGRLLALVKTCVGAAGGGSGGGRFFACDAGRPSAKRFAGDSSVTSRCSQSRSSAAGAGKVRCGRFQLCNSSSGARAEAGALCGDFGSLNPGGVFCNLEHVASPTPRLHEEFLQRSATRSKPKILRTSCLIWKRNCSGCGRLDSWMWIVFGSGGSWRCWWGGGGSCD